MDPPELSHLVRRAQGGDEASREKLLEALRPRLEMVARNYADPDRGDGSASDLVQEAWLRVWQNLASFVGGTDDAETRAKFNVWAAQITRRVGIDARRVRKAKRRAPATPVLHLEAAGATGTAGGIDPAASGSSPSAGARRDEEGRLIRDALEKLPDDMGREAVRLCFFEGLSLREIADRMGIGYDRVKERYRSSMKRLERDLGRFL